MIRLRGLSLRLMSDSVGMRTCRKTPQRLSVTPVYERTAKKRAKHRSSPTHIGNDMPTSIDPIVHQKPRSDLLALNMIPELAEDMRG